MTKRRIERDPPWTPLRRCEAIIPPKSAALMRSVGDDPDEEQEMWANDLYVVIVTRFDDGSVAHLSIRRQDRGHARDWRHFQQIKNEIAGPDVEAVELYPAESRLVDTANQFWLWCCPPGVRFPFGIEQGRVVMDDGDGPPDLGAVQRAFAKAPPP